MSDGGRSHERLESSALQLLRGGLGLPWSFLAGIVAGAVGGGLAKASRVGPTLEASWALGTFLGVSFGLPVVRALWTRASRRRHGRVRVFPDGISFDAEEPVEHVPGGDLVLEEVTDHGVIVALRRAGPHERWWRPRLVPTSTPDESEEVVALLAAWSRAPSAKTLDLTSRPLLSALVALGVLVLLLGCGLYGLVSVALGRLAQVVTLLIAGGLSLDLAAWAVPFVARVRLLPGTIAVGERRLGLDAVTLTVSGGWLFVADGEAVEAAWIGAENVARLRARLGPAVADEPAPEPFLARRRRHLVRALVLLLLGVAIHALPLLLLGGPSRR